MELTTQSIDQIEKSFPVGSLWAADGAYYNSEHGPIEIIGRPSLFADRLWIDINLQGHGPDTMHPDDLVKLRPVTDLDFNSWPVYIQQTFAKRLGRG